MMKNKYVFLVLVISLSFSALSFFRSSDDIYFDIAKNIDIFGRVYREVTMNYVDDISPETFMKNGLNGMLESLDPYTQYIDNSKKGDFDMLTTGKYGGIGVSIGVKNSELTITEVLGGYSAQKQGIRVGDVITSINGIIVNKESIDTISNQVRGEPGTEVTLKIKRDGIKDTLEFTLVREEIQVKSLSYASFLPGEPNILYLKLDRFSRRVGEEIKQAVKENKEKGDIKYCIVDLRNNPGGLLESAVEVLEKFVPDKEKLVETKGRNEESIREYFSNVNPILGDVPLVVLINNNSASASEIVAGGIQDLDRGIIIGTQSFGKGLVQTIIPIAYNSALKITTAKYYTPSGRCIQKLDYMHNKKGAFVTKPDSLKKMFYTKNRRVVFESGGITPDSMVKEKEYSYFVNYLLMKGIFFKFTTYFINSNQNENFSNLPQKKVIEKFNEYLKTTDFVYEDPLQQKLAELQKFTESEKIYEKYSGEIKQIKDKIKINIENEINLNKDDIYSLVLSELQGRIFKEGAIPEIFITSDNQLREAIKIVKNKNLYNKLLSLN